MIIDVLMQKTRVTSTASLIPEPLCSHSEAQNTAKKQKHSSVFR